MIASQALLQLGVPLARVLRRMQAERAGQYRQLRQLFAGDKLHDTFEADPDADRLHVVKISAECLVVGQALSELALEGVAVTALVRQGRRQLQPAGDTRIEAGDSLVLFGLADALARAEARTLR